MPDLLEPGRRLLLAGLVLTITLVAFESLSVATVMPLVEEDLGDLELYGWVFSAYFLGSLVGIAVAGRLADRVHPSVPLAAGLVVFAVGLAVGGAAPSMQVLVLGRALQGLGGGALPAVAYVCIGRGFPAALRPRVLATMSTAWVVPALVGPAVAGTVGEHLGWRWVFAGLLPLLAVCGTMAVVGVRRLPPPEATGPTATALGLAVQVAAGGALLLAGLDQEAPLPALALVAVGGAVGGRALSRLAPPGTLRARRGLPAAVAARGTITLAFFSADAYVPLTMAAVRGASPVAAGAVLTAGAVGWACGSWTQARLVGALGARRLVRTGFALLATGVALTAGAVFGPLPALVAVGTWAVSGLGMGMAYAPISLTVLAEAEPGREGAATSAMQLCDVLGTALGTGLAGALIALGAREGWEEATALAGVLALSFTVAVLGQAVARRLPPYDVARAAPPRHRLG